MHHSTVQTWIKGYAAAWRSPGTAQLANLFTKDVSYRMSPWKEPLRGLVELEPFWERSRVSADEAFDLQSELVAIDDHTAVARIAVTYKDADPSQWRNLWIITFEQHGLCCSFEEWPFAKGQHDGHEHE